VINVTIKFLPKSLNTSDACDYLGSPKLLEDMRAAKWVTPLIERNKMVLFDRADLDTAYARFYAGEYPTPTNRSPLI
jgi:hypothetical protein